VKILTIALIFIFNLLLSCVHWDEKQKHKNISEGRWKKTWLKKIHFQKLFILGLSVIEGSWQCLTV